MTEPANIHTRIDAQLKAQATAVLTELGLTLSDAVRLLLERVARDKALPFAAETPNAATEAAMRAARVGDVARTASIEAAFAGLNAPD